MKITVKQLKQLIREATEEAMKEMSGEEEVVKEEAAKEEEVKKEEAHLQEAIAAAYRAGLKRGRATKASR